MSQTERELLAALQDLVDITPNIRDIPQSVWIAISDAHNRLGLDVFGNPIGEAA